MPPSSSITPLSRRLTFARTAARYRFPPVQPPTCNCRRTLLKDSDVNNIKHSTPRLETYPKVKKPNFNRYDDKPKVNIFTFSSWREGYRKNPISMTVGFITIAGIITIISYKAFRYILEIYIPLNRYPPTVAKFLRRALYYEVREQHADAVPDYENAIQATKALDMDSLSDDVTGIKISYSAVLEKAKMYAEAVRVLETMRTELLEELETRKTTEEERWRVMKRCVGASNKVGSLYSKLGEAEKAEENLSWAVTTILKESRREKEGEGHWTDEQIGGTLEHLATFYEKANRHQLCTPLYLESLKYIDPPDCHSVILMNNVAMSMAQQPLPKGAPLSRAQQLESAKAWAIKALDVAGSIKPPIRNAECDEGCVVALHNLGEMEEQLGNKEAAEGRYIEAESLAKGIKFEVGVEIARAALLRLKGGGETAVPKANK